MRKRGVWAAFAACAGLVVAAIAWVSREALEREESQRTAEASQRAAEAELRRQESVRVALWRLDSALAPIVASETAREFVSAMHSEGGGAVRMPPAHFLRTEFADDVVRAAFLCFPGRVDPIVVREPVVDSDAAARSVLEGLGDAAIRAHVARFEPVVNDAQVRVQTANVDVNGNFESNSGANGGDRTQRMRAAQNASRQSFQQDEYQTVAAAAPSTGVGPLLPLWTGPDAARLLVFVRRADVAERGESAVLQGFVLDWTRLRARLLAEIADVLPGADVRPAPEGSIADEFADLVLATAPIALVAPPAPAAAHVATAGFTATRVGLAVAWAAVFAALAAAAITLRASLADSDRRARFASSVTHELRTPLTTFRLYSEMLADGMVTDPAQRQVYLDTLKSESARLATLVENVLAYARVEEGRAPRQREHVSVAALLDRLLPPLRRRAEDARMELVVDVGDAADAVLDVHADAVGQVLSNLVDNACKYAAPATDRRIEISVTRRDGAVAFRVRDHGPGIAPENVAAAFTPFERGNRPPGDGVPGIGLGLALSRGLARDQGGDLAVEPCDGGACLVLTLPG